MLPLICNSEISHIFVSNSTDSKRSSASRRLCCASRISIPERSPSIYLSFAISWFSRAVIRFCLSRFNNCRLFWYACHRLPSSAFRFSSRRSRLSSVFSISICALRRSRRRFPSQRLNPTVMPASPPQLLRRVSLVVSYFTLLRRKKEHKISRLDEIN